MCVMQARLNDLCRHVAQAAKTGTVLRVRGGGSKDFLGQALQGTELSTSGLRGVLAYEPSELVITVAAATPWDEVTQTLAANQQCLAFDAPQFAPGTTVGGAVAAGLGGPARASVGGVRDFVLGAQLINGRAELLNFGGQVMKNVAGYDLSRVLVGSMGTLGVITQLSLKVLPQAAHEQTLCFAATLEDSLAQLQRWRAQPLPLDASCWLNADSGQGRLWLRLRGAQVAVAAARQRLLAQAGAAHLQALDDAAVFDWSSVRDQNHDFFSRPPDPAACLWRLSVPAATPSMPLGLPGLVEWYGAQRWCWAQASAAQQLRDWAQRAGGHASLFRASAAHGASDKAVGVYTPLPPALQTLNQRLQQQFDPHGVFRSARLG